jgi:SAM-dependent methyltransferase
MNSSTTSAAARTHGDPKSDPLAEQRFWDGWNASGGPKYPRDDVVRFCLRRYPDRSRRNGVRALDLGCGGGVHTLFLADEGFDVTACDISPAGIELTRKRLAERGLKAETTLASLDELPFPARSFDLIISVGVLESCLPGVPEAAMPGIGKLLRANGLGFFFFATDKDYRIGAPDNPFVRRGFTEAEVAAMFEGAFPFVQIDRHTATEKGRKVALDNWMVTVSQTEG